MPHDTYAHDVPTEAPYRRVADTVFAGALQIGAPVAAMRDLARREGLPTGEVFEAPTNVAGPTLFGVLNTSGQHRDVETPDRAARIVQSREHNRSVGRRDPAIETQPAGTGCLWTNRVAIGAPRGAQGTARFARLVQTGRHRRRAALSVARSIRRL